MSFNFRKGNQSIGVSKNRGTTKSWILIGLSMFFHYKPSILGYPYFWKHPHVCFWWEFEDFAVGPRSPSFPLFVCPPGWRWRLHCKSQLVTWKWWKGLVRGVIFPNIGVKPPKMDVFFMENPIFQWMIWGFPPVCGNAHIKMLGM